MVGNLVSQFIFANPDICACLYFATTYSQNITLGLETLVVVIYITHSYLNNIV